MSCERCRLRGDTLHQIAVARDRIREVIDDLEALTVVTRCQVSFRDRHADAVRKSLPERTRRHFDSRRESALRMTGRDAAPLTKLLDLLKRKIVPRCIEEAVQQHRSMPRRKHEAIAVEP